MNKKVQILISCHKPSDVVKTDVFQPVQVGAALRDKKLSDMVYDDDGENISKLNPMYCELTAQYWAWKNLDLDYYGFCHYRRYFSFADKNFKEDPYGNVIEQYIDKQTIQKHQMTDEAVEKMVEDYDIIITERKDLKSMPERYKSSIEQYKKAPKLHIRDYKTMLDIIDEKYPEYSEAAHSFAKGSVSCFCNMYILRKDLFFDYCEWMFDILDEFCKRTNMRHYSTEALRTPGHLSERLFNIYLKYLEQTRPELRVKELQCVWVENTDPQVDVLKPAFEEKSVPVVFAANNGFVPMFAACYQSLLDYASDDYNYDVVLIESDVTKENKQTLLKMAKGRKNISLRFYNPGRILRNYTLKANAHISVETYYRFLIQDVLADYDKVLYLDCDMIINADVAELYQTDVEGYMLAAVRDVDFLGQINGANKDTIRYCKTKFKMKNPYNYVQAGVLLFNNREMRKAHTLDEWLTFASTPYQYNDQDVLNLYCEGHVKYLDMEWNLITDCDHYRINNVVVFAPDKVQKEYFRAHENPKIIHYAGFMKPWHKPTEDYAHVFWNTLRKTDYYEELLYRMTEGIAENKAHKVSRTVNNTTTALKEESLHLRMINKVMPEGSGRRAALDSVYRKVVK
ncbi:MAG: DUF705 domain-containing protein [Lachnospiraceae bacterium]|nr:DUF705 domain-containing protein [Lachnospiraceae bacterium]